MDPIHPVRTAGPTRRPCIGTERSRVRAMRAAFLALQKSLPAVPPDTKLSKLDVLLLASAYIAHLSRTLGDKEQAEARATGNFPGFLHPMKKWPMRSRLYEGITTTARLPSLQNCQDGRERAQPTFLA
ncbi:unnamed protein product [Lampetra planeri]